MKIRPTQFIDSYILKDWIIDEKVCETLFGDGTHTELLKRAAPIISFLSKEGALTQETVELMWKC